LAKGGENVKNLLKVLVFSVLAVFLLAGSAMAVPTTLHDILGYPGTEAYTDTGAEGVYLTDTANGNATAFLILELSGVANENTFGIYDFTVDCQGNVGLVDTLEVFSGAASPISEVILAFDLNAGTVTNESTGNWANIDTTFGFYLTSPEGRGETYYSHASLNTDVFDHMMIFDTSNNGVDELLGSDVVVTVEDLLGGGDQDFNDMVVGVSNVAVHTPEPGTILLLGSGLISLAVFGRKKLSRNS